MVGVPGLNLFERHFPMQLGIVGDENLPQIAPRMRPQHAKPRGVRDGACGLFAPYSQIRIGSGRGGLFGSGHSWTC